MKLIKKIAAIMFAFMMVFSLSTNAKADENSGDSTATGTITIENSNAGQTYNLYRILDLESYNNVDKAYSYKLSSKWTGFLEYEGVDAYLKKDNDYVTWVNAKKDDETMRKFVKLALKYAGANNIVPDETIKNESETTKNITTNPLKLGYYLVSSSAGSLISIDTNNPNKNISEKNGVPTVTKMISTDNGTTYSAKKNSVNAGDHVFYQTTITFKPGAKNYKLHDTMDNKLKFAGYIHDIHTNLGSTFDQTKYINLVTSPTDGCTFEVTFTDAFYTYYRDKIDNEELKTVTLTYVATFAAENGSYINQPMKNTTHLTYGDSNTESNTDETKTYTFGVPVLKYTKDENGVKKTLANAQFNLYKNSADDEKNKLKFTYDPTNEYYRYTTGESGNDTMTSNGTKAFTITGLEAGTYYLKETKAPNGYNRLTSPIKIEIKQKDDGTQQIIWNNKEVTTVDVLNEKGSLLPSTGGAGTTLIYLIGGALVLGSGIVLANKKRAKAK